MIFDAKQTFQPCLCFLSIAKHAIIKKCSNSTRIDFTESELADMMRGRSTPGQYYFRPQHLCSFTVHFTAPLIIFFSDLYRQSDGFAVLT